MHVLAAKYSGEALNHGAPEIWTPQGLAGVVSQIEQVRSRQPELGVAVVLGGGNAAARGDKLVSGGVGIDRRRVDAACRIVTVANAAMFCAALEGAGIPHAPLIAELMSFRDDDVDFAPEPCTPETMRNAFKLGKVAVIGGGDGRGGHSTDGAVMTHATRYRRSFGDDSVTVVKATHQADGVYDADPRTSAEARRLSVVSALHMKRHYGNFAVVDEACLETIVDEGLEMRICNDEASLADAAAGEVGTLIVPYECELVYADALEPAR